MIEKMSNASELINGTQLTEDPFNTVFSPFTDLLGSAFWLIPISVIAAALFMKTKNITVVGAWLLGSGMLMGSANLFSGYPGMLDFYLAIIVIGIISILAGILLQQKGG